MIVAQDEICLITFLNNCSLSVSPPAAVGFPPAALDGRTLASWTTAQREEKGGAGGETSVLKHTFTSHWWKVIFILLIEFLFFFSPSVYSYGESQRPSDKTNRHKHNGFSLDSTQIQLSLKNSDDSQRYLRKYLLDSS